MTPIVFICAAGAASLYAAGSLQIKRSLNAGAPKRRAIAVTNIAMALWALPLFFISRGDFELSAWLSAVAAGVALFLGRILAVQALDLGDLSIVGPLLGMKTLLVAIFSFSTGQAELTGWLWIASIAATAGVILIKRGPRRLTKRRRAAACYAFGASLLFALCDICMKPADNSVSGGSRLLCFNSRSTCAPHGKHPKLLRAPKPTYLGSVIMGFQTTRYFNDRPNGQAVMVNIVYSSRALWTLSSTATGREGVAAFSGGG